MPLTMSLPLSLSLQFFTYPTSPVSPNALFRLSRAAVPDLKTNSLNCLVQRCVTVNLHSGSGMTVPQFLDSARSSFLYLVQCNSYPAFIIPRPSIDDIRVPRANRFRRAPRFLRASSAAAEGGTRNMRTCAPLSISAQRRVGCSMTLCVQRSGMSSHCWRAKKQDLP